MLLSDLQTGKSGVVVRVAGHESMLFYIKLNVTYNILWNSAFYIKDTIKYNQAPLLG